MIQPPIPANETERLAALYDYQLLDSDEETAFDDLTRLATSMLGVSASAVSLVDTDRQWFKSSVNIPARQTGRDVSFCGHTILGSDLMIVPDAAIDPRFADNPLRQELGIRFYAGTPLRDPQGLAVGSLCVLDTVPRELSTGQQEALRALGRQVEGQMNLRRTMRTMAASERFARSTIDALGTHIAILDQSGCIVTTNLAWQQCAVEPSLAAAGGTASSYVKWCEALNNGAATRLVAGIRAVTVGEQARFAMEYEVELQGQRKWFLARVSPFGGVGPIRVVVSHESVTDRRAATEQLLHDSRHDALTGLPNRLNFMEQLERSLKAARAKARFAVLFLDLDRFKLINDSLGHAAGDSVLKVIAERIQSCLRGCDTVARMGGDEFTILIEQTNQPTDSARVARRIGEAVALPIEHEGHELTTTASIGIVSFGGSGQTSTAMELLRDADAAMYKAKAGGRDQFIIFDAAMHREVVTRMQVETDLRKAIARGELELHYQPILKLREQSTCGFEALVRWRRNGVLVSPAQFIPVAEDTGLIVAIGNWVLREACTQLARWRENPAMRDLYITINVSRKQLTNPQLMPTLQDVLIETGLPPQSVVLEITETALMENSAAALAMMQQLRNVGVRLSIDDFGTGYSSLSCLQEFPIDLLKIDRSFVQNMKDNRQAAVVQTIIELAHQLDMTVVAEGVETPEQALRLEQCGCDLTQGYLFAKPLPADAAAAFATAVRIAA